MELVKNFIEYTMVDCIIRNRVVRNKIQVSFLHVCTHLSSKSGTTPVTSAGRTEIKMKNITK